MSKGHVFLVGAGPGDPGLLTLKGLECLRRSDVLVYDRLAAPELLDWAPAAARRVYVGKSPAGHALPQAEINALLAREAGAGHTVTRLKGGDPFVFGRGGEEALYLARQGVAFTVVPGVSSAVAVPAYAGIPVTHRGLASAVSIITGSEDPLKEETTLDWGHIAAGRETLVFLMGMHQLPAICARLTAGGRDPATPAAVIHRGAAPEQVTLTGTLADIAARAEQAGLTNPAVIVVGDVVRLRDELAWWEAKPLFGRRILVTRPKAQAAGLSAALRELGAAVREFPVIAPAPPVRPELLADAVRRAGSFDWIVFTSVNGVRAFMDMLPETGLDIRDLRGPRLAAIGPQTAREIEKFRLRVEDLPERYQAEDLARALTGKVRGGARVLLPRADLARPYLAQALREMGAAVEEVTAYRTLPAAAEDAAAVQRELHAGQIDAVTFTSPSTVRAFLGLVGLTAGDGPAAAGGLPGGTAAVSIGPVTSAAAREMGLPVAAEAETYTADGLVAALCAYFTATGRKKT
ncbi:MAG: uroporphyrinogen-III C-methyltransferase [Gracilibacteraceae bacterium]|jgi:uroporphyrinogen III methyltransferase/synthase|nr:uroporphyrinogen-III C-methyltransferase [Gracilibacteraceae bacterium]